MKVLFLLAVVLLCLSVSAQVRSCPRRYFSRCYNYPGQHVIARSSERGEWRHFDNLCYACSRYPYGQYVNIIECDNNYRSSCRRYGYQPVCGISLDSRGGANLDNERNECYFCRNYGEFFFDGYCPADRYIRYEHDHNWIRNSRNYDDYYRFDRRGRRDYGDGHRRDRPSDASAQSSSNANSQAGDGQASSNSGSQANAQSGRRGGDASSNSNSNANAQSGRGGDASSNANSNANAQAGDGRSDSNAGSRGRNQEDRRNDDGNRNADQGNEQEDRPFGVSLPTAPENATVEAGDTGAQVNTGLLP